SVFIATMYDPEITGQNDFDHSANVISTIEISNGKPQPVKRTVFSDDFYKMYLQQEEKFEKWRRIDNSKIQAFHTFSNGDWVVIIEDGKIATQLVQVPASPGKPATSEKAYTMTYGNLGIFCFDGKTHQIKWEKALLKKQTQANRTGSTDQVSFASAIVNDHLHIFYNDMEKNGQPNWKSENGATIERNPNDGQFFTVSHQILDMNGNSLVNAPLKGVYEPNFFSNDGLVR